jgi:hypothetical protein
MAFDLNAKLKEFVIDILELDIDGRYGEIVDEDGAIIPIGRKGKVLALRRSKGTDTLNFCKAAVVGVVAQRLSILTFGSPDRFYREGDAWGFYIGKDMYIGCPKEDKLIWLSFVELVRILITTDLKKIEDKSIKVHLAKVVDDKSTNMDALKRFYEWVVEYRLDKKTYLQQFFEKNDGKGFDTSKKTVEEKKTDIGGGVKKDKIDDAGMFRTNKSLTRKMTKAAMDGMSMEDIARSYGL